MDPMAAQRATLYNVNASCQQVLFYIRRLVNVVLVVGMNKRIVLIEFMFYVKRKTEVTKKNIKNNENETKV